MKFYNREKEVAELKRVQELAFTQNSRMIVVTGRRRIGKTSLIKEALKGTPTVYLFIGRKAESILVTDFVKIVEISRFLRLICLSNICYWYLFIF